MRLVDGERLARTTDGGQQRLLPARQLRPSLLLRAADDDGVLQILQNDITLDRQIKCRGGQRCPACAGKTPVINVIDQSRRKPLRCIPARHDYTLGRITADREPCSQIIEQHCEKPAARKQDGKIVT